MRYILLVIYLTIIHCGADIWEDVHIICPIQCVCQRTHFMDLSVARWSQDFRNKKKSDLTTEQFSKNDAYENDDKQKNDGNPYIKFVMCMLQEHNNIKDLLVELPHDVQALVLLYKGNKENVTMLTSDLLVLTELYILEVRGTNDRSLQLLIDEPLTQVQYVNFETIALVGSENTPNKPISSVHPSELFDYVPESERTDYNISIEIKEEIEIVPYDVYIMEQKQSKMASFYDWKKLAVLRIHNCKLDELHWQMFDGLTNLEHLSLEHNEIKIVPPFTFYGALHIKTLSLAHNNILDLNYRALAGLLELEWLNLSDNNITKLSEISFPPFPKLNWIDFRGNPIKYIFPMSFGVMNNTETFFIGSNLGELDLSTTSSFLSLEQLKRLKLENVYSPILNQNTFKGLISVEHLTIQGNIKRIEFDTFSAMINMRELILKDCGIQEISMDIFYGLNKLEIVDLSMNKLLILPPGLFDEQPIIKEIYLQNNELSRLPSTFFDNLSIRMIRLTNNPWICSCDMLRWKQAITNRIRSTKKDISCHMDSTKTTKCSDNHYEYNYIFDNKLSPRCNGGPTIAQNRSVYYSIRKTLQCTQINTQLKNDKKLSIKKYVDTVQKQHIQSKQLREEHIEHRNGKGLYSYIKKYKKIRRNDLHYHLKKDMTRQIEIDNSLDNSVI